MADGIALEGMRLIHTALPRAAAAGGDLAARAQMMAAATMGAVAFQKGLGAIHALSHPLGALYDAHHGQLNGILMPYVLAFNRDAIEAKMARLATYLGLPGEGTDAVLAWIIELRRALGIPNTLRQIGIDAADTDRIIAAALVDPTAPTNPVPLAAAPLRRLFLTALG
jgi:alcohol dehydrogenase class IV